MPGLGAGERLSGEESPPEASIWCRRDGAIFGHVVMTTLTLGLGKGKENLKVLALGVFSALVFGGPILTRCCEHVPMKSPHGHHMVSLDAFAQTAR